MRVGILTKNQKNRILLTVKVIVIVNVMVEKWFFKFGTN